MTTKHFNTHFNTWGDFETYARYKPCDTQYLVQKLSPAGLDVLVIEKEEERLTVQKAETLADIALGDSTMKCVVTEVTEFGTTGTVVPRFP